jgi:NAD(P)-dependent dehydrogenase (short-subunit alcohol dehydrogenase family)
MRGLEGKRVLVNGGSSGIGEATARRFLEEGSRVLLTGLEEDQVERAVEALGAVGEVEGLAVDVGLEGDVTRMIDAASAALGGIDVLINNAGTAWRTPFLEITAEEWDRLLAVNLRGMFLVGQAVAHVMVEQATGGAIINMASTNGLGAEADYAHYNTSKGGVVLLTKSMAIELGKHGIRVNCLCPGYIETELNASIAQQLDPGFQDAYARERIPLARTGRPDEVAAAYAFLASDDASFITGSELVIDGGQVAVM